MFWPIFLEVKGDQSPTSQTEIQHGSISNLSNGTRSKVNNEGECVLTARLEDEDYELESDSESESDSDSDESSFESESS